MILKRRLKKLELADVRLRWCCLTHGRLRCSGFVKILKILLFVFSTVITLTALDEFAANMQQVFD
jgi:hypothetical protein